MYQNNKQMGRTRVHKIKESKCFKKTHVQFKKNKITGIEKLYMLQNDLFKEGLNANEYNNYIIEKINKKNYYYQSLTKGEIELLKKRFGDLIQKENNKFNEIGNLKKINRKRRFIFKEKKRKLINEKKKYLIETLFKEMKKCSSIGVLKGNEGLSSDPDKWNHTKLLLFSGGRYIESGDKGWTRIYQKINSLCSHYLFDLHSNDALNEYVFHS